MTTMYSIADLINDARRVEASLEVGNEITLAVLERECEERSRRRLSDILEWNVSRKHLVLHHALIFEHFIAFKSAYHMILLFNEEQ